MSSPRIARLRGVVESRNTVAGRVFDASVQTLIVLSLVSFSVETLPNLPSSIVRILRSIEVVTIALFSVEYALRVLVAKHRLRFVLSFFGLVDLLAILPFYLSTGIDFRSVRSLRLLRLFRTMKILRYSRAIRRLYRAITLAREEFVLFLSLAALLLFLSAVGIYYFENEAQPEVFASIFHSLWWSVTTLTTVGYGDVYPVTMGGRIFTFIVLVVGVGIVAVPTGLVSSALSEARRLEREESMEQNRDLEG